MIVKTWIENMQMRMVTVKLLHIGLNDTWRLIDVVFVITGWVL